MTLNLHQNPPRKIPLKLIFSKYFRDAFFLIGLSFVLFGTLFFTIFFLSVNFTSMDYKPSLKSETQGTVIDLRKTNAKINRHTVIEVIFEFEEASKRYRSHSYTAMQSEVLKPGSQVSVEFLRSNPEVSRIKGMQTGKLSPVVFYISGIFPVIGLFFIALGTIRTFGLYRILRYGCIGPAYCRGPNRRTLVYETPQGSRHSITLLSRGFSDGDSTEVIFIPSKPHLAIAVPDLKLILKGF